jgi:hypothetical protein
VAFGSLSGGVFCPRCPPRKRQVVSLSASAWQALATLADGGESGQQMAPLARSTLVEARSVMNHYVAGLLGHEPRLQPYLTAAVARMTSEG